MKHRNKLAKVIVARLLGSLEANAVNIALVETLLCEFELSMVNKHLNNDIDINWESINEKYNDFKKEWQDITAPSTKDFYIDGFLEGRKSINTSIRKGE